MCLRSHLSQMTYFRLSRCLPKDFMRSSRVSVNIEYKLSISMDITKKSVVTLCCQLTWPVHALPEGGGQGIRTPTPLLENHKWL